MSKPVFIKDGNNKCLINIKHVSAVQVLNNSVVLYVGDNTYTIDFEFDNEKDYFIETLEEFMDIIHIE